MTTDGSEIERAFLHHRAEIYRFLIRRTRDPHEAEDLTQQVFVDAAEALARSGPPRSMRGWLFTVARRRLVDEVRRRSRIPSVVDADTSTPDQAAGAIAEAVLRLPEAQRRIVVMRVVEGRSYAEIARTLGCNEAACRMRLSRALRRLRAELELPR